MQLQEFRNCFCLDICCKRGQFYLQSDLLADSLIFALGEKLEQFRLIKVLPIIQKNMPEYFVNPYNGGMKL